MQAGDKVVDVDGSYLWRKYQAVCETGVNVAPLLHVVPDQPLSGWELVTETNYKEYADRIPRVTPGTVHCRKGKAVYIV